MNLYDVEYKQICPVLYKTSKAANQMERFLNLYFMFSCGKEPIENVCKGEAHSKKKKAWANPPSITLIIDQSDL